MKRWENMSDVAKEFGVTVPENESGRQLLVDRINELLNTDFQKLVSILYRMDINEAKLRQLLKEKSGTDAGLIIADMMIDRVEQKKKSRSQFKQRDDNISNEEKW
jgi:hypothetical protein